ERGARLRLDFFREACYTLPAMENPPPPRRARFRSFLTSDRTLVLAVLAMTLAGHAFGERIQVNEGQGWDGRFYCSIAKDFYRLVVEHGLSDYHVQRILPSAVVHYSFRLLSIPLTTAHIIGVFGVLNVLLVTLAAHAWCRVAAHLGIGPGGKWLGFLGLF